jgi:nicotinate-nucleotide pyrophosphorylase (carboxylating)
MSLADAVLIKDNHVAGAGSVAAAITAATAAASGRGLTIEVECDTVAQVSEAIEAGLEASGGLTLPRARDVALTGVDYLAVGALTHSAPTLDIGLDLGPGG